MRKTAVAGLVTMLTALCAAACGTPAAAVGAAPASVVGAAPAAAVGAEPATCSTHWGTGMRDKAQLVQNRLRDVRVGRHACFDRLVFDLGVGRAPGYHISYVSAFRAQGSGKLVPATGHAKLLVNVRAPAAASFSASNRHLIGVAGFAEFRQVASLGSFEGITSIGLGLRATAPFRVLEYQTASHHVELVVDVANR
jgi:hypothetical protein